jgi:acyl-CoA synthetase (AMP-forming)/AMP-acid ligase II
MSAAPSIPTIRDCIEANAAARPDRVYARAADGDAVITYRELEDACRSIRSWLRAQGIESGDTVSVVMPNGLQTLQVLLAAMSAGCCVNPVNLLSQPDQMRYVLDHSDCKLVCVAPEWEEPVKEILRTLSRTVAVVVLDPESTALPHPFSDTPDAGVDPRPSSDAVALLMYTSGTTGVPKGVMLTQGMLIANALSVIREHALGEADRVLAVLPLYHINAFVVTMLAPLANGGSLVVARKFSAARFWNQIIGTGCTWINVVPTIISYLLEGPGPQLQEVSSIRFCRSASAALPPEYLLAFEKRFGIGIIETMGLTETAAPAFSNPLDPLARKLGSVGRASGCDAGVVDAATNPVADGVTGEVVIRGPNVLQGYYKNPTATASSFTSDGWFRTGDLGFRDADGFFFITGRIKELIIKGGENIAPREIDEALLRHPQILDAAAVGIPDRHFGQDIMACVVLREGEICSEEDLRTFCHEHLGRYKTPSVFRFISELPRGPSGKVQRLKLLDLPIP